MYLVDNCFYTNYTFKSNDKNINIILRFLKGDYFEFISPFVLLKWHSFFCCRKLLPPQTKIVQWCSLHQKYLNLELWLLGYKCCAMLWVYRQKLLGIPALHLWGTALSRLCALYTCLSAVHTHNLHSVESSFLRSMGRLHCIALCASAIKDWWLSVMYLLLLKFFTSAWVML